MTAERSLAETDAPGDTGAGPAENGLLARAYGDLDMVTDRLEQIEAALEDLQEIGDETVAPAIRKLRRQMREFEPSVTMIGQVKAGKTSLVNAMIGWPDFLPADINPWTSVVTSLHVEPAARSGAKKAKFSFFSEEEWQHLLNRGGRVGELAERAGADRELEKVRQQLEAMREKSRQRLGQKFEMLLGQQHEYGYCDEELIQRYVCLGDDFGEDTSADPGQGRFADITKSADIHIGASELPMRMCIRDTPGVNDTFMIREQITVNAIRQSRLCVVVLSAHQALSTVDMALIRLISNIRSREVIIFVNRIDELADPAREIQEIRSSIVQTLRDHDGPTDAEIIFGSAFWAGHALSGEYRSLGKASAEALLNLAKHEIDRGLSEARVEDMVWELSGVPALCSAIAGRIRSGEGAEFEDRIVRSAQNVAQGLQAAADVARRRVGGAPVKTVAPGLVEREMASIRQQSHALLDAKLDPLLAALQDRLDSSRRTFLARATSSLVKHLDVFGEGEVWTYDPSGLRVLLRSGYQLFAKKAAGAAEEVFGETARAIRTLFIGAFQPTDDEYDLSPPVPPRPAAPVMLGQTIALDIQGNWWTRWWRKRRSYEAFADEFSSLIDAEIEPMVAGLSRDHAETYRGDVRKLLDEFIDSQRASLLDLAGQTEAELQALRQRYVDDAEDRAGKLQSALSVLADFRQPVDHRKAAE
ncbi:hypothetical protein HKCCE2091_14455 [Rhodobacterales bacterium HKCCE2091]|nr:hypothetical protein [Rhodobacterales bacterium HKCCE2091]